MGLVVAEDPVRHIGLADPNTELVEQPEELRHVSTGEHSTDLLRISRLEHANYHGQLTKPPRSAADPSWDPRVPMARVEHKIQHLGAGQLLPGRACSHALVAGRSSADMGHDELAGPLVQRAAGPGAVVGLRS